MSVLVSWIESPQFWADIYYFDFCQIVFQAATANDGLSLNYRVIFIEDASRGIDIDDMEVKKKMLTDQGAIVVSAKHVYNMVIGRDRRPELGYAILGMAPWTRPEWILKHSLVFHCGCFWSLIGDWIQTQ